MKSVFAQSSPAFETGASSIEAVRVLRISVTDRCNFRCVYCMPEKGVAWLPREGILSFEEIHDIVKAAIEVHGITKFKLTGGEPTLRHGLVDLVRIIAKTPGITDLSMTTNGYLLEELATPLYESGLHRLTVSIDSLHPDKFKRITRTGDLAKVLRGLDRTEAAGFNSTKINCVAMRGTNDDELADFARMTLSRNLTVRFIEYMPLGDAALMNADVNTAPAPAGLRKVSLTSRIADAKIDVQEVGPAAGCGSQDRGAHAFISEPEIRQLIERELGPIVSVSRGDEAGVGPAEIYRLSLGNPLGRLGFISAMSAPFCSTCNRLRLTADGTFRSCLFEGGEVSIRNVLRATSDLNQRKRLLADAMTQCIKLKPAIHSHHGNEQMSRIGG